MDQDIQQKVQAAIQAGAPPQEATARGQALQAQRSSVNNPTVQPKAVMPPMPSPATIQANPNAGDQQKFQQAYRGAGTLKEQSAIGTAWKDAHGYDLFGDAPLSKAQKDAQAKSDDYSLAKGHIQNLLDTFQQVGQKGAFNPLAHTDNIPVVGKIVNPIGQEYGNQVSGMAAALAPLVGGGAGSGLRITKPEIESWGKLMPSDTKTGSQNQADVTSLDKNLTAKFGQGLDPEYLKQFGVIRDDKGNYKANATQPQNPTDIATTVGNGLINTFLPATKQALTDATTMKDKNPVIDNLKRMTLGPVISSLTGDKQSQDQLKAGAEIGSYMVPFGAGKNILTKAILPAMTSGALQGASQNNATPASIAGNAVLGGAAGTLAHGVGGVVNKIAGGVASEAAQGLGKATPSNFANAVADHGYDLNQLIQKHVPAGSTYESLLGTASDRGNGGILGDKLKAAENTIQGAIKGSGNKIVDSGEGIIDNLIQQRNALDKTVGNQNKISAIDSLVKEFHDKYPSGLTAQNLLDLKRGADSTFGKAVVEDEKGSAASSAQKIIGNQSRKILKANFPQVADALNTQSELYTLNPILNKARGTAETQGSTIRSGAFKNATDIVNPIAYKDAVFNNPKASSSIMKLPAMLQKAQPIIEKGAAILPSMLSRKK